MSFYIINNSYCDNEICVESICQKFNINRTSFSIFIKQNTGMSFTSYIKHLRVLHAKKLLIETTLTIQKISEILGFSNQHYFTKVFKDHTCISPLSYRKIKKIN